MGILGSVGKVGLGATMAVIIWGAFLWARPAENFVGESSRIVFFHVPQAWVASIAFLVAAIYSALYLRRRRAEDDDAAAAAARLGIVFCVLATITGSIFAKVMWNSYWNWDPRETSIVALLLIYGAYFALRSAIDDEERRAALSASYAILAVLPMLFLIFVLPRVVDSLHPSDTVQSGGMSPSYRLVFFAALFGFTLLFVWIYRLRVGVERLALRREG